MILYWEWGLPCDSDRIILVCFIRKPYPTAYLTYLLTWQGSNLVESGSLPRCPMWPIDTHSAIWQVYLMLVADFLPACYMKYLKFALSSVPSQLYCHNTNSKAFVERKWKIVLPHWDKKNLEVRVTWAKNWGWNEDCMCVFLIND